MAADLNTSKVGGTGGRGISYPAMSLEAAVKRARQLWDRERKNPAPIEAVAAHWGYSPTSSGVRTTVAALLSFGLVADHGSGETRHVQLTPRGLDIVLETPERDAALRAAVISPKIYAELLKLWPENNLPSDQTLKVHLLRHKNFNPKAVDGFIKDFRDSLSFSGLANAANMPPILSMESSEVPEMQSQLGERSHGGRSEYVQASTRPPVDREWSIDLSTDTTCRVLISGSIGPEEIDVLIEYLKSQKRIREKKRGTEMSLNDQAREDHEA